MDIQNTINSQNKTLGIKIFSHNEWDADILESLGVSLQKRASSCIQHLIKNSHLDWKELNILEVWPLPIFELSTYVAPIAIFQEDMPEHNYLWFGTHLDIVEQNEKVSLEQIMWKVSFIEWLIYFDDDKLKGNGTQDVLDFFNGKPDIIYWSHVYENSWAQRSTFPVGREGMIEGTARVLKEEWYLVVDNACGYLGKAIWKGHSGKSFYSKHMIHVASYFYDEENKQGIHIFQKPKWTDDLAKKEIVQRDLDDLNRELSEYNRKIQRLLNSLQEKINLLQNKKEKIPGEIEKLQRNLEKVPSGKIDVISRMNDSILRMTKELEEIPDLLAWYREDHVIKIRRSQKERKNIQDKIKIILSISN